MSRPKRTVPLAATIVLALTLAACGPNGGPTDPLTGDELDRTELPDELGDPVDDPTVRVVDNDFEPEEVVVTTGSTVTWSFEGSAPHDVEGDGFASEILREGTFSHTFEEEGSYPYRCTLHPGMTGTVHVRT